MDKYLHRQKTHEILNTLNYPIMAKDALCCDEKMLRVYYNFAKYAMEIKSTEKNK